MNSMRYLGVFLAACLSCALSGCVAAAPDEAEDEVAGEDESAAEDENSGALEEGEEAEAEDATSEVSSEIQSQPANLVGCGGGENWCLAKCSKTNNHLHVLGPWAQYAGICQTEGEKYCRQRGLGYRTLSCWGHL